MVGAAGEPDFGTNWSATAGSQAPRFRKDSNGIVYLEGDATGAVDTAPDTIFTLSAGFRPGAPLGFVCQSGVATQQGFIEVNADGMVVFQAGTLRANTQLTGIIFRAEG